MKPKPRTPSVTHKWKHLLAVGCSHGDLADDEAIDAVLRFRDRWKPDWVAHLGDAFDTAAFRSGAKGTKDESRSISPDANRGLDFITKLRPNVFCVGNHEDRLYSLRSHPNAVVSELAEVFVSAIEDRLRKVGCSVIVPYNVLQGYHEFAGYKWMHGFFYNEMACRDHAETWGNCVHAHTHQAAMSKGRRADNPTAFCVGTLTSIPNMDYALRRRKTLAWCAGFVWGVYHDDVATLWLHQQPRDQKQWVLPA